MEMRILRGLKKGPFVEFNTTGFHWDESSLFLDEDVYGFFSDAFAASNIKFDYYGPTAYQGSELSFLCLELEKLDLVLNNVSNSESLLTMLTNSWMGQSILRELESTKDPPWTEGWLDIAKALKEINKALLSLAQQCTRDESVLWVLGI